MKMSKADQNRIVEPMKDVAAGPGADGTRRAKVANEPEDKTGKTATSLWKCPTCRARKVFKRRRTR